MNMRKRKNAGRLLSRLLCLVTVMGMGEEAPVGDFGRETCPANRHGNTSR